jgi:ribosomal protein S12 methylthiotransferase accessory factor YcaO
VLFCFLLLLLQIKQFRGDLRSLDPSELQQGMAKVAELTRSYQEETSRRLAKVPATKGWGIECICCQIPDNEPTVLLQPCGHTLCEGCSSRDICSTYCPCRAKIEAKVCLRGTKRLI